MRKIVTFGIAAVFATLPLAMTTIPANAGGISFGFGGIGHHYYHDGWYDSGIVIEVEPEDMDDEDTDWEKHVSWCDDQFETYDEDTDMYFYASGKQKHCISPWS